MINVFLQYFFLGLPFVPGPMTQADFPFRIESGTDTSIQYLTIRTYRWTGESEIVEDRLVATDVISRSRFLLGNGDRVTRMIRYRDNSDSIDHTQQYEYQDGFLAKVTGGRETSECSYRDGRMDSVRLVVDDAEDSETLSYRFHYDTSGRLVQAEETTLVPNNNPGPDKRFLFRYSGEDSLTLMTIRLGEMPDTSLERLILEKGRPVELRSTVTRGGKTHTRIKRYAYQASAGLRPGKSGAKSWMGRALHSNDLLGRRRLGKRNQEWEMKLGRAGMEAGF